MRQAVTQTVDPLTFAEEWSLNQSERTAALTKRERDRQVAESLAMEQTEADARALQSSTYSPGVLRRGSNAGAMYPTPPDAIHHPVGPMSVFDGAGSTPNNPNPFVTQDSGVVPATSSASDTDVDMWETANKKQRSNDNDADLFGDLGGDIFGNDVTDADFSFFDEPDEPDDLEPQMKIDSPEPTSKSQGREELGVELNPATSGADTEGMQPPPIVSKQLRDLIPQSSSGAMKPPQSSNDWSKYKDRKEVIIRNPSPVPFNQESIYQRLVNAASTPKTKIRPRRESLFDMVNFENSLSAVDDKYAARGAYDFTEQTRYTPIQISGLPQTNYLSTRKQAQSNELDITHFPKLLLESKEPEKAEVEEEMEFMEDSNDMSPISEQDDMSHSTDEPSALPSLGFEKRWLGDNGQGDVVTSFDPMAIDFEQSISTPQSAIDTTMPLLDVESEDWSLATYFTSPEPEMLSDTLTDLECIATAQVLVDQVVSGTIPVPWTSKKTTPSHRSTTRGGLVRTVAKVAKLFFKDFASCTLRSFSEIQGIPLLNQGMRLPPRPVNSRTGTTDPIRANNPFPIPLPQLELRRSNSKLSVLSSAVAFWENLGFAPSGGSKDILSICVYPNIDGAESGAAYFNDQMRNTYESFRLGTYGIIVSRDLPSGHLPYDLKTDRQHSSRNLTTLRETVARLANAITSISPEDKNFVIYFMYPTDNPTLLVHICSAFQHLFHLYRKALMDRKIRPTNELVLELVPMDLITSSTTIPIPLPIEYGRLCLEVYGRCMDFASSSASPAIMLERPLPRGIDFKLSPMPSASVLQENMCLHIAYAQSFDNRWITAVWTDNRGTQQMTASYCLGRRNESVSIPFSKVAAEIWETTIDFVSHKKIHWRILVARVGIMEPSEVGIWTELASRESDAQTNLTLLTVQTEPSTRLLSPALNIPGARETAQTTTPVSTPQNNTVLSPETPTPTQPSTTPSDQPATLDPDPTTRLLLLSDQSHGLVLSHRLSNSRSLINPNPALISGYLIKHSTPTPVLIEVNIIHSEVIGNPRTYYEALLREVLVNFARLGTLSRARGTTGPGDARPWHIAGAEKAVQALQTLM